MIKDGVLQVGQCRIDVTSLDEATLLGAGLGAVEKLRNGEYSSFLLTNVDIEGGVFNVRFFFVGGKLTDVELHIVREYGPEWNGREWDESFLEMQAWLQEEWLGRALGATSAVRVAKLPWGTVSVAIDKKGWDASIHLTPSR